MAGPVDPRLIRRARATKWYLVAGLAVGLTTAMLAIAQAWLLSRLVVAVFSTHQMPEARGIILLALVFAARALLGWGNQVLAHRSAASVKSQLRHDVLDAAVRNPMDQRSSAETVRLATTGLDALDGYYGSYLPQLLLASTVPFIVVAVVAWTDWISAAVMVVTLPLIPIFMALIGWTTQVRVDRRWKVANRLARHFADLVAGLPTLQVFGRAAAQQKGLEDTEQRHRKETMGTLRISFLSSFVLEFMATISVALLAVGIGLRVVAGGMPYLTGLFVLILSPEAYLPIRLVGTRYHDSADGLAAADAAFTLIDAVPPSRGDIATKAGEPVRLHQLGHTYPGTDKPALSGLSLDLVPGRVVALSGTTGGGKSTALSILMGFLHPTEGSITVAGTDLAQIEPQSWRRRVAWVGQEPGMIDGSVADNVRLGDPAATDQQIYHALACAGAATLSAEQHVGEDGVGLSAGERRRVALARALLRLDAGADLLILDEPTAGLDADAEATVLASVLATARERGTAALVVTHRAAVLAAADHVVTLEAVR